MPKQQAELPWLEVSFPTQVTPDATTAALFLPPCQADTLLLRHPSCSPGEQPLLLITVYFSLFIPAEQIHFDTFG